MNNIYFTDINKGWIVAGFRIFNTTDGGLTWAQQLNSAHILKGICFADTNNGTVVGDRYGIFHTTDGGQNWNQQYSPSLYSLYSVSFVDLNIGWAVGADGLILHTINGGISNVSEELDCTPMEFALYHNYPNPFNPSTTIKFALPTQSNVRINIYNSLGQLIGTLVNKEMESGYHEVNFDASRLSSGVYLYQLQAGDYVSVKKMLLLK